MNSKDFIRLRVPLGIPMHRATDFVSKFILSGGDKSRLWNRGCPVLANQPGLARLMRTIQNLPMQKNTQTQLCPVQKNVLESLLRGMPIGSIFRVWGGIGRGKTTVLKEVHKQNGRRVSGHDRFLSRSVQPETSNGAGGDAL